MISAVLSQWHHGLQYCADFTKLKIFLCLPFKTCPVTFVGTEDSRWLSGQPNWSLLYIDHAHRWKAVCLPYWFFLIPSNIAGLVYFHSSIKKIRKSLCFIIPLPIFPFHLYYIIHHGAFGTLGSLDQRAISHSLPLLSNHNLRHAASSTRRKHW